MRLQQKSRLKKIVLVLGAAMSLAVAGSGFAQQQTKAPAGNEAVGGVSATAIGAVAIAIAVAAAVLSDTSGATATK